MNFLNDIKKYNLVNDRIKVVPNYDLSNSKTSIKIYIDLNGNLIIMGVVDNNYIHWASLTKTKDKEINEAIFNHIANESYDIVSQEYKALKLENILYEDLKQWYCTYLIREDENNMAWRTPFGHYYGKSQIENNGKYFVNDIANYLDTLQIRCSFREGNGEYVIMLRQYYKSLVEGKEDYRYYEMVKPLIDMLKNEDYLILSKNKEIRELYLKCMDECSNLYNQYMSAVR